jgi:malate/lactate dehydrogenase
LAIDSARFVADRKKDLFNTNASIVRDLAKAAAEAAPNANILVISNPVRLLSSTLGKFKC